MQQIFPEKKKKQMSEAVFVRFTAHSNMEGRMSHSVYVISLSYGQK